MGVFKKQGNWWIDFYHQGKRVRRKVGPSKRVAEMALADIQVKKSKNDFLGVCDPKTHPVQGLCRRVSGVFQGEQGQAKL